MATKSRQGRSTGPTTTFSKGGSAFALVRRLEGILELAADAEQDGAINLASASMDHRLSTGSFYTPADVVEHFWRGYFAFHGLSTPENIREHLEKFDFVEPSLGAGIFLFGLLHALVLRGCTPDDLSKVRFSGIDLNPAAVEFVGAQLATLQRLIGRPFANMILRQGDFRQFVGAQRNLSFVGNPPYVKNLPDARWKNLYADFLERMLTCSGEDISIGLIVPVSINFSRDYRDLRQQVRSVCSSIRIESFDNIPDCLFNTGKPGHRNTNKANSQRCSIIFARRSGNLGVQATSLQNWSTKVRAAFLAAEPIFLDVSGYAFDGQFPRPSCSWIIEYLHSCGTDALTLGDLCGASRHRLAVGGVARNFIGVRELEPLDSTAVPLVFAGEKQMRWGLQLLASPLFFEYWRTVGDGFHVTKSDLLRFPISFGVLEACMKGEQHAGACWRKRTHFERLKRNSGKDVRCYDFRQQFDHIADAAQNAHRSNSSSGGFNITLPEARIPRAPRLPLFGSVQEHGSQENSL